MLLVINLNKLYYCYHNVLTYILIVLSFDISSQTRAQSAATPAAQAAPNMKKFDIYRWVSFSFTMCIDLKDSWN